MCDPQLGMGGYEADVARFKQAVKQINVLKPDLVVICGDLVNAPNKKSFADFKSIRNGFRMPCYCAPGNHDVRNEPTVETLRFYRKMMGKDYYSFAHKGCRFVIVNTQLWKSPVSGESEAQDAWFKRTLEAGAAKHERIFVVSHYPLFVTKPDEAEGYYDLPPVKRRELLELFQRCGVVAHLAGHTHKTIFNDFHGIQMVTSETTSRNFDHRPFGFRLWHVDSSRPYAHEFIPLNQD
jgi:3',5'-cyclic AMP phosphodiesterase CpdA